MLLTQTQIFKWTQPLTAPVVFAHIWLGAAVSKQALDLSLIFVLELSVHHSECAMKCVPTGRQRWGVLFCSNGMVTPSEIMVIILWLTLTLPHCILMTVQLIHFYCLCLGMDLWSFLLMPWKLRVYVGLWGDLYPVVYLCSCLWLRGCEIQRYLCQE